jgi:hypothetical protein
MVKAMGIIYSGRGRGSRQKRCVNTAGQSRPLISVVSWLGLCWFGLGVSPVILAAIYGSSSIPSIPQLPRLVIVHHHHHHHHHHGRTKNPITP